MLSPLEVKARAELERRRREQGKIDDRRNTLLRWAENFVFFTKSLDVLPKGLGRIKVQQTPILKALEDARTGRDYILKARQVFMTTWEVARDIWYFLTKPGSKVVILCQSDQENNAIREISERIRVMLGLDDDAKQNPDLRYGLLGQFPEFRWSSTNRTGIREQSSTKWTFGTSTLRIMGAGATVKSASKKGRAGMIHRLHVTEISFFEYANDSLTAILQCVPDQSVAPTEIVFESTPQGAAGYFYENYRASKTGENGYKSHFFPWFQQQEYRVKLNPGEVIELRTEREKQLVSNFNITSEQIKWYRQKVADQGQAKINQEFPSDEESCWLSDGRTFFDQEALTRIRATIQPPVGKMYGGKCKIWFPPEPGQHYVIGADPSGGTRGEPATTSKKDRVDYAVAVVLERGTGKHCATFRSKYCKPSQFAHVLAALGYYYNYAHLAVERNQHGGEVHNELGHWERPGDLTTKGYPNIYAAADRQLGFLNRETTRVLLLDSLDTALRRSDVPKITRVFDKERDIEKLEFDITHTPRRDASGFITYDFDFIEEALVFIVKDEKPQAMLGANDDCVIAMAIAWHVHKVSIGLNYTDFAPPPSINYENTPIAFDPVRTVADDLVDAEKRRWAGATNNSNGGWTMHLVGGGIGDIEGF